MTLYNTRRNIIIGFICCLLPICFFAFYSYRDMREEEIKSKSVFSQISVLNAVDDILDDMLDIETGQRGYIISGKDEFLGSYYEGINKIKKDTLEFYRIAKNFPDQVVLFNELLSIVRSKLDFAAQTIRVRKEQGYDAASVLVQSERGRVLMDSIRQNIVEIEDTSREKLSELNVGSAEKSRNTATLFIILSLLSVTILSILFILIYKGTIRRDLYEKQIAYLASLTENTSDAVISIDLKGNIRSWNKGAEAIYGYTREEVLGRFAPDITRSGTTIEAIRNVATELEQKEKSVREARHYNKAGEPIYCLASTSAIRNDAGVVTGFVSILRDISDRVQLEEQLRKFNSELSTQVRDKTTGMFEAEEALQKSEERYKTLIDQAGDAITLFDGNGRVLEVNNSATQLLGYTKEEFKQLSLSDILPREEISRNPIRFDILNKGGVTIRQRIMRKKDGSIINTEVNAKRLSDGRFIALVRDLTEREQAEREIRELQKQFSSFMETLPARAWIVDENGSFHYMNSLSQESAGGINMTGKNFKDSYPQEAASFFQKDNEVVFDTNDVMMATESIQSKDGRKNIYQVFKFPLGKSKGIKMMGGIALDITDQHRFQERLKRLNEQLAVSNRELEQFAYVASHDLQEPLRMVSSFLQLLKKKYPDQLDETARQYIDFAVDGADRMKTLISDLLNFSRVNSNQLKLSSVDLNKTLSQVKISLQDNLQGSGAKLVVPDLPTVQGDATQLSQLFQNLIGNAIKYKGASDPLIEIDLKENEREYEFVVRDNGIGFEQSNAQRIFVIFQRLHTKNEYSGTGIGLAICKKIIERHGGRIWAQSVPGKGSEFYFTLAKNIQ